MRLDLPTLERPANATSTLAIGGSVSIEGEAQTNCHSPANSFRPCSISFASVSAFMRRGFLEGAKAAWSSLRAKRSNPPIRGGSMDCFVALLLAMTRRAGSRLLGGLLGERRLD